MPSFPPVPAGVSQATLSQGGRQHGFGVNTQGSLHDRKIHQLLARAVSGHNRVVNTCHEPPQPQDFTG
jgi:hypothetical protein